MIIVSALETWRMSSGLVNLPLDKDYINCGSKAKVHSLCLVVKYKTEKKHIEFLKVCGLG